MLSFGLSIPPTFSLRHHIISVLQPRIRPLLLQNSITNSGSHLLYFQEQVRFVVQVSSDGSQRVVDVSRTCSVGLFGEAGVASGVVAVQVWKNRKLGGSGGNDCDDRNLCLNWRSHRIPLLEHRVVQCAHASDQGFLFRILETGFL